MRREDDLSQKQVVDGEKVQRVRIVYNVVGDLGEKRIRLPILFIT